MTIRLANKGGQSLYPTIKPYNFGVDQQAVFITFSLPGFDINGDSIELPGANPADNINYFDNTGALVWTKDKTDFVASATAWVGFMYDKTDDLIYCMMIDNATTPNTYHLASVNKAGTITNIGAGAQPTVDFTSEPRWSENMTDLGASNIYRNTDGAGNIFIRILASGGATQQAEINIATGAFVSDPASLYPLTGTASIYSLGCGILSPAGVYASYRAAFIVLDKRACPIAPDHLALYGLPSAYGISVVGSVLMEWGDYIAFVSFTSSVYGARIFLRTEFYDWMTDLAIAVGCS